MSLYQFFQQFPNEESARTFFEERRWHGNLVCPHCSSVSVATIKSGKPMPYRCKDCREHFGVRTGTVLSKSKLALRKWLMAIYLLHTARKGISSIQIAKELGITQKTAWFLNHRIREAMKQRGGLFGGAVEVDETYMGGKEKNKHAFKKLKAGRGTIGKKAIAGVLQRGGMVAAKPIDSTDRETLYGFIKASVQKSATIYTDDHRSYLGMEGDHHEAVKHSIGEYIREQAHTHYSQSPARTLCRDG
ncbi:IS1595 family transposase [Candidatus Glomeribacter gigasporarum]|uniref:IS1595 family transposase n=1 Tax=Candidatus Glomeribacter gigasporarum TaxID=132144 RepID=UPI00067943C9|nr:IS1595 family transposase [Candidatus Glomeribacter gigasporarum]